MTSSSIRHHNALSVGMIAPKNAATNRLWPLELLKGNSYSAYHRGGHYDLVYFLNLTEEIRVIKKHTGCKIFVVALEPGVMCPENYDPEILGLADHYMGYKNFSNRRDSGFYEKFIFPVEFEEAIRREFPISQQQTRNYDFCIFARHDPNIRVKMAEAISGYKSLAVGPIFTNNFVSDLDRLTILRKCRYQFMSENDITDYYVSEKPGYALMAGCVPVYYGCSRINEHIPRDMIIDMHEFTDGNGKPDLTRVIQYCLKPGTYEKYRQAIQAQGMELLIKYTIEKCFLNPFENYANQLRNEGFCNQRKTIYWRWRCLKQAIKSIVCKM